MSVSTPILTTSSEIWAWAVPVSAASARPAASVVASNFKVSSPWLLVEGLLCCGAFSRNPEGRKARRPREKSGDDQTQIARYWVLRASLFPLPLARRRANRRARGGEESHKSGSLLTATFIAPCASTITLSVFESKATSDSPTLLISASTRTPLSFFWNSAIARRSSSAHSPRTVSDRSSPSPSTPAADAVPPCAPRLPAIRKPLPIRPQARCRSAARSGSSGRASAGPRCERWHRPEAEPALLLFGMHQ